MMIFLRYTPRSRGSARHRPQAQAESTPIEGRANERGDNSGDHLNRWNLIGGDEEQRGKATEVLRDDL